MISHNPKYQSFFLQGKDFTYAMRVEEHGYLTHTYYGKSIPEADLSYYHPDGIHAFSATFPGSKGYFSELSPEYSVSFLGDYRDPAFIHEDERGARTADFKYESYEILKEKPAITSGIPTAKGGETLVIILKDYDTGLRVKLFYTVYECENILTRRAEIINNTGGNITLHRALSFSLDYYDNSFSLLTEWGHHANEKIPECAPLRHGKTIMGNIRGTTSAHYAPFTALLRPGTTEEAGEVFAANLIYSGSHYECVEVEDTGRTRVNGGINPDCFSWRLAPGESFETPEAALCYSCEGLGGMSRSFHDFIRDYLMNPRWAKEHRPVVLNSWEGMYFDFDEARLYDTIDALSGSGVELFVLDDGWFGTRNDDHSGLGDWFINKKKIPHGLSGLAERCHKNGLKFGFWIEPEMVNPDSDLYRAHPDWAIAVPGRDPLPSRNQYVLDFSRPEVVDYIKKLMYDLIKESGTSYIKWDMNRSLTENWSYGLPADRQGELQHRYVLGVYELARYLTSAFPDVLFEGCSGGGGRFDGAMLAFFPQIWTSDNTDPNDRAVIQYGTQLVYPLSACSNHVACSPNHGTQRISDVRTRTDIAYAGAFGYEFDIRRIPAEDLAQIPADVAKYREIDDLVLKGDLYRGTNRLSSNTSLTVLVSKDKNKAFAIFYQALNPEKMMPMLKIPGLDPQKLYHIEELDLTLPGGVLGELGVHLRRFKGDFKTKTLTILAV